MKPLSFLSLFAATTALILPLSAAHGQEAPRWQTDWQNQLANWLQSLTQEDVTVPELPFDFDKFDPEEKQRNWQLSQHHAAPLPFAQLAIRMAPDQYIWPAVWRGDLPTNQEQLKTIGVTQGQIWTPTHPSFACHVAWLYSWDRPWNPYYRNAAVGRRAAVISIVTLIMTRSDLDERNVHTGIHGFGLTFNAFTYQHVAEALPESARKAWEEGLRWYSEAVGRATSVGPENMQLSAAVGIYRTGMALKDDALLEKGHRVLSDLLASHYSLAGYIRDAGVPDASYNGISLHRLNEFWAISKSPQALEVLRAAYRLKELNVLPEPGLDMTLSPSHFNARCQDGFDLDQYTGREVMILPEIPEAAWFARKRWGLDVTHEEVIEGASRTSSSHTGKFIEPEPWGSRKGGSAPHDWGRVLGLPYFLYHSSDPAAAEKLIREAELPYILLHDRYTKSLNGEFHFIRRPAYGAIFYTGPARGTDKGRTNLNTVLKDQGGYHTGFGGGGLSAFWTPKGGSLILGRMSGREAYFRLKNVGQNNQFTVWGWQDWLNNQLVGETEEGKVVTSSRTTMTRNCMNQEGTVLEILGAIPKTLPRQGQVTEAEISYRREYRFDDEKIECIVEARSDLPLNLRSFHEALPLVQESGRGSHGISETTFLDADGNVISPHNDRYEKVHTVRHTRFEGGMRIVFPEPVTIAMVSEPFVSKQARSVTGRSLLIELPVSLSAQQPLRLTYHLYPTP